MGVSPSAPDTANNLFCCNGRGKNFSTANETSSSAFAVVDHSKAYENSMRGRHGQQLSLARLEGIGKDDLPFDPFEEEEQRYLQEHEAKLVDAEEETDGESDEEESDDSDDDDDYDSEDSDSDSDSDEEVASIYNSDGSVRRNKSVLATLKAGHPAGGLFAVVEIAGSQHKVTTDDLLVVNKLKPVDDFKIGSVHTLKDVLLVGSSHLTLVGMPHVTGAEVDVMVEEITQDAKVIVFKKRRRKHSQRKNGYRRDLTLLRVLDVRLPEDYKEHDHVGRESVDDLETVSLDNGSNYDDDASHFDIGNQISDEKGQRISPAP
jgi:large subunit ribosomal protein L21